MIPCFVSVLLSETQEIPDMYLKEGEAFSPSFLLIFRKIGVTLRPQ